MFRTLPSTAETTDYSEAIEKKADQTTELSESRASTESDPDAVERASSQDAIEEIEIESEKKPSRPSSQLKRTASNSLSRVASRVTTHSLPDPGPAPDGGLKAWTQVAMGWLAIATTWGWINCFGRSPIEAYACETFANHIKACFKPITRFTLTSRPQSYLGLEQYKTSSRSSSVRSPDGSWMLGTSYPPSLWVGRSKFLESF